MTSSRCANFSPSVRANFFFSSTSCALRFSWAACAASSCFAARRSASCCADRRRLRLRHRRRRRRAERRDAVPDALSFAACASACFSASFCCEVGDDGPHRDELAASLSAASRLGSRSLQTRASRWAIGARASARPCLSSLMLDSYSRAISSCCWALAA